MKILGFMIGWLAQKGIKLVAITVLFTVVFAFANYLFSKLTSLYTMVQDFINYIFSNGSTDINIQKFFGLLNCIGFFDALNNALVIVLPAVAFYFSVVAYHIFIKFYSRVADFLLKVI